ncbi:MAG: hypothetical protein PHC61_12005, partial [Chitinivibrionales bacterium]|nr:hypothetical protein [Chitinivibrionales bacterium]
MKRIILQTLGYSLLSAATIFGQSVTFTSKPVDLQFYARDNQDSGAVAVEGSVTSTGTDSISVTVYKNGSLYKRVAQALSYSGGSAPFSIAPKIHAELASYKFEVRAGATLVATADSILCGDAFYVDGQSNAVNLD